MKSVFIILGNGFTIDFINKYNAFLEKKEEKRVCINVQNLFQYGSNWVGVHLVTYFALQRFFISANRPVPRFLFLDQPSQVYFPSELDEKKIDWEKVNKMYQFIIDRTKELSGKLQVIVVDHANLEEKFFRQFICEDWWPVDQNLVPNDWYEA